MANPPVFTIVPNPHWVIIDNFSKLPDGAAIYTYSSLDPSQFKPAFQDAAGTIPYGQPIEGFGNGTMPPIFWEFDPANPTDTYYIRVYDSADITKQNFLWDFNGLSGSSGSGGGTVVMVTNTENLVINNTFFRNAGDAFGNILGTPSLPGSITIAPSNFDGFVNDPTNGNVVAGGPVGPDIIFAKNDTTASDFLSFTQFTPFGIQALTGDVTPEIYLKYACTVAASGTETYKYIQFPIDQGVAPLAGQTVSIKIWAQLNSGDPTLTLRFRQFFGSGGAASNDVFTPIGAPITLIPGPGWNSYIISSIVIPSVAGFTRGTCHNDGLFLQIGFPLNALTNIDIIKPAIYMGMTTSMVDFVTNDEIDTIISKPRTGDIRIGVNNFNLDNFGWIFMNDGTIGDASSGATSRANVDTFPLFSQLWNLFQANQTFAPMFTSVGTPVAYGASPVADFTAHNRLSLTVQAGRVISQVSLGHALGSSAGFDTHILTTAELPSVLTTTNLTVNVNGGGAIPVIVSDGIAGVGQVLNFSGNNPMSLIQPTVYLPVFIKL